MKTNLFVLTGVASLLMLMNFSAQAAPVEPLVLVQRNCMPNDLRLDQLNVPQLVETNCHWLKQRVDDQGRVVLDNKTGRPIAEDPAMQVTLFIANTDNKDIYVQGQCSYTRATDSEDKVVDVATSKAGSSIGLAAPAVLPQNQYRLLSDPSDIRLVFKLNKDQRNFDESQQAYQANVIFDLNKEPGKWYDPWSWRWLQTIPFKEGNKITCSFQLSSNNVLPNTLLDLLTNMNQ